MRTVVTQVRTGPGPTDAGGDRVRRALEAVSAGRPVVVTDDEDRENEGDLIFAAELSSPELMAFTVRHTSGYVCVALPGSECDRLGLPPMRHAAADSFGTGYTVTVDAVAGTTTGISAADRARTARALADPTSTPRHFARPGHVVPLRARDGGVLRRAGHTEAAVDLARLAGLRPAGVLCEIVSARHEGEMARLPELEEFAAEHGLEMISIAELAAYRRHSEPLVAREAQTSLPTERGLFRAVGYRGLLNGAEHVALVAGDLGAGQDVPVHIHQECLIGDVIGSLRCDCRRQLTAAMETIGRAGRGVVVYVRAPVPDRAVEVVGSLRAPPAEHLPGADPRTGIAATADVAEAAAHILVELGIRSVRLCETAAAHGDVLAGYGILVGRAALSAAGASS